MTTTSQYWVIVGSRENFEISKELGFTVQGVKSRAKKKALEIRPGDRMIYYLTGLKVLAGIITVESEMTEDRTRIWPCSSTGSDGQPEVYPYRFKTKPYCILDESDWIPVEPFHSQLQYLKKWPEKNWTLGFQGNLHHWPEADYRLVESMFLTKSAVVS